MSFHTNNCKERNIVQSCNNLETQENLNSPVWVGDHLFPTVHMVFWDTCTVASLWFLNPPDNLNQASFPFLHSNTAIILLISLQGHEIGISLNLWFGLHVHVQLFSGVQPCWPPFNITCTSGLHYLILSLLFTSQSSLYVFGGRIEKKATNELWTFDTGTLYWHLLPSRGDSPLAVAGHTATLVNSKMVILFGYGPERGYTDKVQEYDLGNNYLYIVDNNNYAAAFFKTTINEAGSILSEVWSEYT